MEDGFYWLSRPIRCAVKQPILQCHLQVSLCCFKWYVFLLNWLEVLQYKATAHTGGMDLKTRVGSAVSKGCTFLLFQYLHIIKLTKIILKKEKSQLALPTNSCSSLRNPNPVEFPLVVNKHHHLQEYFSVLLSTPSKPGDAATWVLLVMGECYLHS